MKLREIRVQNFRCLADVAIPIGDTTVLVGANNAGKTALLDALRIVLTGNRGNRGTPFDEYDYHMSKVGDSPQTSQGIVIELWFREDTPDEWPDSLVQALNEIIQTDPVQELDAIRLRISSKHDAVAGAIMTTQAFLTLDGQPLVGRGANSANLGTFLSYVRLFYLSSLRDANDEFSPRSQHWGRILRSLEISEAQSRDLSTELAKLNESLLKADPKLEQVRASFDQVQRVMRFGAGQHASIQALPLKPWDLMSRSEVALKAHGTDMDFPLSRHGQGMQSLGVLFLFQAYIDVLLKPTFQPETEAILALEEPEAHLHPQATHALAANLGEINSQKIISSHSPYFIQEIPFTHIRMFRRQGSASKVLYVKQSFTAQLPYAPALADFCTKRPARFVYHENTSVLILHGRMDESEYRELLSIYAAQREVHAVLRRLREESQLYLSSDDLTALETYAKRIRGEVLFARAWLLCEGPSEYLLLRYFADLLGTPLDQAGVTVIDFQNNGSPGAFVGLACVFEIPWLMLCDHDSAREGFVRQVRDRGLTEAELRELVRPLPEDGMDWERFLVQYGFIQECRQLLAARGVSLTKQEGAAGCEAEIAAKLRADKTGYATALIEKLRSTPPDASKVPPFLKTLIEDIIAKASS